MSKEIITFDDIGLEKHKFYLNKSALLMHDINIDRILVSSKVSFQKKIF